MVEVIDYFRINSGLVVLLRELRNTLFRILDFTFRTLK